MQCVEEELMLLEGSISNYLPTNCALANPFFEDEVITVEMLLRHSSSLKDTEDNLLYGSRFRIDGGEPMTMSLEEYVRHFVVENTQIWSSQARPGTVVSYSNAGFTILGLAVETVRKQPLQQAIQTRIFDPLGMRHSSFFLRDALATPGCVVTQPTSPSRPAGYYEVAEWPAAQLRSTAPDILRFLRCFTRRGPPAGQPNILGAPARARMQPPGGAGGLAWWGRDFGYSLAAGAWQHGGFMQGIRSHAFVWAGGALVLLFNAEDPYEARAAALVRALELAPPSAPDDPAAGGPAD